MLKESNHFHLFITKIHCLQYVCMRAVCVFSLSGTAELGVSFGLRSIYKPHRDPISTFRGVRRHNELKSLLGLKYACKSCTCFWEDNDTEDYFCLACSAGLPLLNDCAVEELHILAHPVCEVMESNMEKYYNSQQRWIVTKFNLTEKLRKEKKALHSEIIIWGFRVHLAKNIAHTAQYLKPEVT